MFGELFTSASFQGYIKYVYYCGIIALLRGIIATTCRGLIRWINWNANTKDLIQYLVSNVNHNCIYVYAEISRHDTYKHTQHRHTHTLTQTNTNKHTHTHTHMHKSRLMTVWHLIWLIESRNYKCYCIHLLNYSYVIFCHNSF